MLKALVRYLMLLGILLVTGYGQTTAMAGQGQVMLSAQLAEAPVLADFDTSELPHYAYNSPEHVRRNLVAELIEAEEETEEEDEKHSWRRLLANSPFFSYLIYDSLTGFLASASANGLSLARHYTFTSAVSPIYLLDEVFRI